MVKMFGSACEISSNITIMKGYIPLRQWQIPLNLAASTNLAFFGI